MQIHHSTRSGELAAGQAAARPREPARHARQSGFLRRLGACLSHADGQFWLVYTDVKRLDGSFKDAHNYIVTAPAIEGPWSDPVYVNSSGFDPSLFHDDDGRKWFLNMLWNHSRTASAASRSIRPSPASCCRNTMPAAGKLVGPVKNIFAGSPHGLVEGPHLFKRNGWYYLTTAEGGTGYDHAVTMARSRTIDGPYELHPDNASDHLEGCAGRGAAARRPWPDRRDAGRRDLSHASLLAAAAGHAALAARPRDGDPEMRLGRRRLAAAGAWRHGAGRSRCRRRSGATAEPQRRRPAATISTSRTLPLDFQWLRTPYPGAHLLAVRAAGLPAAVSARESHRQLVRAGAGGAPAGAFLASRRDRGRFRARRPSSRRRA